MSDSEFNEKLKRYSLWLLGRRDYSEKELRTKFKEKEYLNKDIEKVIDYLKEYNYQSDERFARMYINSRISRMGISKIKSKLMYEKGISKDTLDEILADESMEFEENDSILRMLQTKYRNKNLRDHKEKSKAVRFFASKGFSFDDINKALSEFLENE